MQYRVRVTSTEVGIVTVEAENEDDAIEKAITDFDNGAADEYESHEFDADVIG